MHDCYKMITSVSATSNKVIAVISANKINSSTKLTILLFDNFYFNIVDTLLEQMLFRIPSLGEVEVHNLSNGPESFSPDCKLLLGEAPEVRNYFVATGMKATGMEAAGGVGKITADWIVNGEPKMNLWDVDIRRFLGLHNNRLFLRDRMVEVPGNICIF
ncbi:UNVERIFIED_CONTAM: Pyruvate dehydrogenase phosphatase regulatory subunit [Trichonephila clavipes]